MAAKKDDFDATRVIIDALEPFEVKDRERIIRWACEKLGMAVPTLAQATTHPQVQTNPMGTLPQAQNPSPHHGQQGTDIKTFLSEKSPKSNNQLAATVAYYHMFEAPEGQRRNFITKEDLQNACRLGGLTRLPKPEQTLVNAHHTGLLDKGTENGTYTLNSVGENLVAMTLPSGSSSGKTQKRKPSKKVAKKKK